VLTTNLREEAELGRGLPPPRLQRILPEIRRAEPDIRRQAKDGDVVTQVPDQLQKHRHQQTTDQHGIQAEAGTQLQRVQLVPQNHPPSHNQGGSQILLRKSG